MNETSDEPWFTIDIEMPADASARQAFASLRGVYHMPAPTTITIVRTRSMVTKSGSS